MPVIGWSRYSSDYSSICSIELNDRSLNVVSYNVSAFIFVFLFPLGTILTTSFKILSRVSLFDTNNFEIL